MNHILNRKPTWKLRREARFSELTTRVFLPKGGLLLHNRNA